MISLVEALALSRSDLTLFNRQCVLAHTPCVICSTNATPKGSSKCLRWPRFFHSQWSEKKWSSLRGKLTQRMKAQRNSRFLRLPLARNNGISAATTPGDPTACNHPRGPLWVGDKFLERRINSIYLCCDSSGS